MTPTEMRAKAKALRKEALDLIHEADAIEAREAYARRVASSREAIEAKAAGMCRPVWRVDPGDGSYVVDSIGDGCFVLRRIWPVSHPPIVRRYRVRCGSYVSEMWASYVPEITRSRLDNVATMTAWREWCAARKAAP